MCTFSLQYCVGKSCKTQDISISRSNLKFTLEHAMDIPLKIIILKRINNTTLFNETAFDVDKSEKLKEVYSINNIFFML